MNMESIKYNLEVLGIFHSEGKISGNDSVVGYEKRFKLAWMATQLNTFYVISDFGDQEVTIEDMEENLSRSFDFAKENYTGWPRGLQSALGVVSILVSTNLSAEVIEYCEKLKSGKKWAAFTIPVVYNPESKKLFRFTSNPMWGAIYYPHFKRTIDFVLK